jgi:hypothetical protein
MKITFKKVAIGALTALGIYAGYRVMSRKGSGTFTTPTKEQVFAKSWVVKGTGKPIDVSKHITMIAPDGTPRTTGYPDWKGKFLSPNLMEWTYKDGKVEYWEAQGMSGFLGEAEVMPSLLS